MKIWRLEDAPEYFSGDFGGTQKKNKKEKKKNRKRGEGSRKCGVVRCIFEVPSRKQRGRKKKKKNSSFIFQGLENAHDFIFCDYMPKAAHWSLTDYMKTVCLFSGKQKKKKERKVFCFPPGAVQLLLLLLLLSLRPAGFHQAASNQTPVL